MIQKIIIILVRCEWYREWKGGGSAISLVTLVFWIRKFVGHFLTIQSNSQIDFIHWWLCNSVQFTYYIDNDRIICLGSRSIADEQLYNGGVPWAHRLNRSHCRCTHGKAIIPQSGTWTNARRLDNCTKSADAEINKAFLITTHALFCIFNRILCWFGFHLVNCCAFLW